MNDLEEAIDREREALAITPNNHPDRAAMLNNLGKKLASRYEGTGKMEDMEEAIAQARDALAMTPDNHSDRAARLHKLENMIARPYERTDPQQHQVHADKFDSFENSLNNQKDPGQQ